MRHRHARRARTRRARRPRPTTPARRSSCPKSVRARTITAVHALLDDRLAPRTTLHGVLVDVFGVGLLLIGCELDRQERVRARPGACAATAWSPTTWSSATTARRAWSSASPADLLRHHIEVRGLGILNIKDLFGVTSIRERKRIDVVVKLVEWSADTEYDRMGVDDHFHEILGVSIRELVIPVRPGRNMGSILEIAARNELLRDAGHHGAKEFFQRIEGTLLSPNAITEPESMSPPAVSASRPEGRHK